MSKIKITLALLILGLVLGCSDKQSSDEGEKELKDSFKLDFLNAKYMMGLSDTSWEGIQLSRLENGKFSLTFSFITPYESKDCVLQGQGEQKGDEFYFFNKGNDLKILFKRTEDGLVVNVDNKKIENVCGKDHIAKGTYTISQ